MNAFDKAALLERRAQLDEARQKAQNEFYRLVGAIQLCNALIAELDASTEPEKIEEKKQ